MTRGRKSNKRYIIAILKQLPPIIENYPSEEQAFLKEFLKILKFYSVNQQETRLAFLEHSEAFIKKYYLKNPEYYQFPFLWFAVDYFNIGNRILSVDNIHADRFFPYLVKHLRDDPETQGLFRLVNGETPLTSLKWEPLQYSSNKFIIPLTEDELLILQTVNSLIKRAGINNLTQQRIKSAVAYRRKKETRNENIKRKRSQELRKFFTLLDTQWRLRLYPPAFGLERLFIHFQMSDSNSMSAILGLIDPNNTTLNASVIYREPNFSNYMGILLLPTKMMARMEDYLKECEEQRKIKLFEMNRIKTIQISRSLALYEANNGWQSFRSGEIDDIIQKEKNKIITPQNISNWHFQHDREHATPSEYITLYCKAIPSFSYSDLMSSDLKKQENFRFTKQELDSLSYLHEKQVVQMDFDPIRLMRDFSLNEFWIGPLSDNQKDDLRSLTSCLPDSHIISTEGNTHIWTRLTPEIVQRIKKELRLPITPVIEQYGGKLTQHQFFDQKSQEWMPPQLLI